MFNAGLFAASAKKLISGTDHFFMASSATILEEQVKPCSIPQF